MNKLIINEQVNISTVGDLKQILEKYNDDLKIEVVSNSNADQISNIACNSKKLFINLENNESEDIEYLKNIFSYINEFIYKAGDENNNIIPLYPYLDDIYKDEIEVNDQLLDFELDLSIFKNLFSDIDLNKIKEDKE